MNYTLKSNHALGEKWDSQSTMRSNSSQWFQYKEHFEATARFLERAIRLSKKQKYAKLRP